LPNCVSPADQLEARVAWETLSEDERGSLRALLPKMLAPIVPSEHEEKLSELGLIRRTRSGLFLTEKGEIAASIY